MCAYVVVENMYVYVFIWTSNKWAISAIITVNGDWV